MESIIGQFMENICIGDFFFCDDKNMIKCSILNAFIRNNLYNYFRVKYELTHFARISNILKYLNVYYLDSFKWHH